MSIGGLDRCACKRGFFTLRDCENPATTTCSICSRRVCDQHLAPRVDVKVCAECAARQEEQDPAHPAQPAAAQAAPPTAGQAEAIGPPLQRLDPTSFAVRRRFRYYRSYGYNPMWWGTPDPYWNDWGYRWYGDDDDDDDGGGFGDS